MKKTHTIRSGSIAGRTGYIIHIGTLIPTYRLNDHDLVLFDSGRQEDPALIDYFEERGLRVEAVLLTHLHFDHTSNSRLLQRHFGTKIYVGQAEMEGVFPPSRRDRTGRAEIPQIRDGKAMPYNFTMIPIGYEKKSIRIQDTDFAVEDLCGHTCGHLGYGTPDRVLCLGDAILSPTMVELSKLPYFEYQEESVDTMKSLLPTRYDYYALSHRDVVKACDMPALVQKNIRRQEQLRTDIIDLIEEPVEMDELIDMIIYGLDIQLQSQETRRAAYASAVRYIEGMIRAGKLRLIPMNGMTLFARQ